MTRVERAVEVTAAIAALADVTGYPPSISEIAAHLGLSRTCVHEAMRVAVHLGLVEIDPGRARAVRITTKEKP